MPEPDQTLEPELTNFKETVELYLKLSGYTPQLCQYLVKTVDFLDDLVNNRLLASEITEVTYTMLMNLGGAVATHYNNSRLRDTVEFAKNRSGKEICQMLLDDINGAVNANVESGSVPGDQHP